MGGLSLTTAAFVFQACYGTPQDFGADVYIHGLVKSKKTDEPVKGIKVSVANFPQYQFTDDEGKFAFYSECADSCTIKFEDIDSAQNGTFIDKDTVITNPGEQIYLNVLLEEK